MRSNRRPSLLVPIGLICFFVTSLSGGYVKANTTLVNHATGSESINVNTRDQQTNTTINVSNTSNQTTDVRMNFTTGRNRVVNNTTVEGVETGSIESVMSQSYEANTQPMPLVPQSSLETLQSENRATGTESVNQNIDRRTTNTSLSISNTSTTNTTVNQQGNTGNNTIARNTTVGGIVTGGITSRVTLTNRSNAQPTPSPAPQSPRPTPSTNPTPQPTVSSSPSPSAMGGAEIEPPVTTTRIVTRDGGVGGVQMAAALELAEQKQQFFPAGGMPLLHAGSFIVLGSLGLLRRMGRVM